MIEGRGVVVFPEKMAKTGLVGKKTADGAYDEGARGFLCTEKTRRISVGRTQVDCVIVKHCKLKFLRHGQSMHSLQNHVGRHRYIFVTGTKKSTSGKEKKDVLARRHLVRAIASDGRCGNSDDTCISSGSKNNEDAVDLGFHQVERLSGRPMQPALLAVDVDHEWERRCCVVKVGCVSGWIEML